MAKRSASYKFKRAIEIVDWIEWLGYPTKRNIVTLENLVLLLQGLAPLFKRQVFLTSIKELTDAIQKIKATLKKNGEVPVPLYTTFNAKLILFKENLISDLSNLPIDGV